MRKKRFLEKCEDFLIFEDQTLLVVKQQFDKYVSDFDKMGLALDIELLWYYRGSSNMAFSRIEFRNGYTCAISLQVRRKEDPKDDLDLEAITLEQPIDKIRWPIYWISIVFYKIPSKIFKAFMDDSEETFKNVIEYGYEKVLGELRQNDK